MACNDNPTARLNEFCQKNKLTYSFEKTGESSMSHNKLFTMRLTIARHGCKEYIQFCGEGNSLKTAKNDAAEKAFKAGIIHELKKVASSIDGVGSQAPSVASMRGSCMSINSTSQFSELVEEVGRFTMNDGPIYEANTDPIYEAYTLSKTYNMHFYVEFRRINKGIKHRELLVRLYLGNRHYSGKGESDLEAIYNAAGQIKSEEYENYPGDDLSSDDDSPHTVIKLNQLNQQYLNKTLDFTSLTQLGPPQDPLFIFKCALGDLVSYGLGKNKKASKNRSAYQMLKKLGEHVEIETMKTNLNHMEKWVDDLTVEQLKSIVYSEENAISVLERLDQVRFGRTLSFTESGKEIGVQMYFTTVCKLLYEADLKKIHNKKIEEKDTVTKGELVYLRTTARTTKKKTSKTKAAEKMLNLIRGEGAFTNEEARLNRKLAECRATELKVKEDQIDMNRISKEYQDYLIQMTSYASDFLEDKPNYDPDYDFLAELQDLEFAYRGHVKLDIKSSNEIYMEISSPTYSPFVDCVINFSCGLSWSAHAKSDVELEAKNMAAYELLKKMVKIKSSI